MATVLPAKKTGVAPEWTTLRVMREGSWGLIRNGLAFRRILGAIVFVEVDDSGSGECVLIDAIAQLRPELEQG